MPQTDPNHDGPAILIVDDQAENLRLLSHVLNRAGYRVRVANSGTRALQSVHANPPDMILLDIMMPDINGYTVCETLKADIAAGSIADDIPILFISALDQAVDKVRAFEVGGVDYIPKPFQAKEVLARVQTHLALRDLRRQQTQHIAELDAYAQTVAHDIKSPLGIITTYAAMLTEMGDVPEPGMWKDAVTAIATMGYKMSTIVDNLLLFADVRHMDTIAMMPLDTAAIIAEACNRVTQLTEQQRAQVVTPATWPAAKGYAPWVEEVWVNLISNAIRYGGNADAGDAARVELGAEVMDGGTMVRFWVQDNGPGIAPEVQSNLFRATSTPSWRSSAGHGLGLSIVERIVTRLGGTVGVESAPGQGSTFSFTLPGATDKDL